MKTNIDAIITIRNIFKTEDIDIRKKEFNKRYENFINAAVSITCEASYSEQAKGLC